MFVRSPRTLSWLLCLGTKKQNKTAMYVYLLLTIIPQVVTSEPLRLMLPLRVRKEEKVPESPLGMVRFLQRNEESFHHVSCKPVTMPRDRNRGRNKGTQRSWLAQR